MKFAITLALIAAIASAKSDRSKGANGEDYMEYVAKFNKSLANREEFAKSRGNWKKQTEDIFDLRATHPETQWGLNSLSDLSDEEFAAMQGLKEDEGRRELSSGEYYDPEFQRELQTLGAIDWTASPNLSPVKDQLQCGSCWVFNASVVLETMISIKKTAENGGVLVAPERISEQEGVDCVYTRDGCQGGWPTTYWNFTRNANGANLNSAYPYKASYSGACLNQSVKTADSPRASSYGRIAYSLSNVHAKLEMAPLSVALSAGNTVWRNYSGGVVMANAGCPTTIDHAVVLVGFEPGTEIVVPGTDPVCRNARNYEKKRGCRGGLTLDGNQCCSSGSEATTRQVGGVWNIQNSWGSWGENGFIRFEVVDGAGVCGMNNYLDYLMV